jgi:hypothetical protein
MKSEYDFSNGERGKYFDENNVYILPDGKIMRRTTRDGRREL